jgi:hypothetical protein
MYLSRSHVLLAIQCEYGLGLCVPNKSGSSGSDRYATHPAPFVMRPLASTRNAVPISIRGTHFSKKSLFSRARGSYLSTHNSAISQPSIFAEHSSLPKIPGMHVTSVPGPELLGISNGNIHLPGPSRITSRSTKNTAQIGLLDFISVDNRNPH